MSPNHLRFQLLEELTEQYHVDGIVDVTLQACHPYTVERDKMRRFCARRGIAYLPVEADFVRTGSRNHSKTGIWRFLGSPSGVVRRAANQNSHDCR